MTRNKIWLCSLFAGLALSLSACGQNNTAEEAPQITVEEIPAEDNADANNNETIDANNDSQDEEENSESGDDISADASEDNTNSDYQITITFEEIKESESADDGTEVYSGICNYPVVEIAGNPEAAEHINAGIMETVEAFRSGSQIRAYAKDDYAFTKENYGSDEGYADFYPYTDEIDYSVARADTDVISLVISSYSYAGGAHGDHVTYARNFDPNTGMMLAFSDLSDDAEMFRINTLEYNQKTAATEEYAERLFTTDSITNGELENVLYEEGEWYFSEEGLVFISNPYLLGPWSSGTIEFTIPYDELAGLGMKEVYSQPGTQAEIIDQKENEQ